MPITKLPEQLPNRRTELSYRKCHQVDDTYTYRTEPICLCFGPKFLDSSLMAVQINSYILSIDVISRLHLQLDFGKPKHPALAVQASEILVLLMYLNVHDHKF